MTDVLQTPTVTASTLKDEFRDHFIKCPKFGGQRPALACIHYDRYRQCRKKCKSLEAHLTQHPEAVGLVDKLYVSKGLMPVKYSGKNLPKPEITCKSCGFVAKSLLGLKSHTTRQHTYKKN